MSDLLRHSGLLGFYKIFPRNASGGVNLTSVCGLVTNGNNRSRELPGYAVRPKNSTTHVRQILPVVCSSSLSLSLSSGQVSYPSQEGCVCVHPDSKLRVFGVSSR